MFDESIYPDLVYVCSKSSFVQAFPDDGRVAYGTISLPRFFWWC